MVNRVIRSVGLIALSFSLSACEIPISKLQPKEKALLEPLIAKHFPSSFTLKLNAENRGQEILIRDSLIPATIGPHTRDIFGFPQQIISSIELNLHDPRFISNQVHLVAHASVLQKGTIGYPISSKGTIGMPVLAAALEFETGSQNKCHFTRFKLKIPANHFQVDPSLSLDQIHLDLTGSCSAVVLKNEGMTYPMCPDEAGAVRLREFGEALDRLIAQRKDYQVLLGCGFPRNPLIDGLFTAARQNPGSEKEASH